MSILNWLSDKNKTPNKTYDTLKAETAGGIVTPIVGPLVKPPHKKLLNRLKIINQQIETLKNDSRNSAKIKLKHWQNKKDKTKALLWIYYDENYDKEDY